MVKTTVEALKEKKGYDIKVIDISDISILADYFIIANGNNTNQVQAMVDNVEEQMYKAGFNDPKVEGYNNASWILLDYNDIVIHVFDDESRSFYNLERLWKDGKEVDIVYKRATRATVTYLISLLWLLLALLKASALIYRYNRYRG